MPNSKATMDPHEAMRRLGAFMEEHQPHGGEVDIEPDRISLWCHGCRAYEILMIGDRALKRAMGAELSERQALTF